MEEAVRGGLEQINLLGRDLGLGTQRHMGSYKLQSMLFT